VPGLGPVARPRSSTERAAGRTGARAVPGQRSEPSPGERLNSERCPHRLGGASAHQEGYFTHLPASGRPVAEEAVMATVDYASIVREGYQAFDAKDVERFLGLTLPDGKVTLVPFGLTLRAC